jgi:hypothetical protein
MGKAVTLFIQGHGKEDINTAFENKKKVQLLSFVGKAGELGTMKLCKQYNYEPIDVVILDFLYTQYRNSDNLSKEEQKKKIIEIAGEFPDIYKKCGIVYDNGFTLTWPRFEREFILEPAPHENCRVCNEKPSKQCNSKRCLPERRKHKICCPEYGLTVVSSSFEKDIDFTLSGSNDRIQCNMNMNLSTKEYWKTRADPEYRYLIDQIYDEKYIHLTDVYLLFHSMGFDHVYIYDPTCRETETEIDNITAEQYRKIELTTPEDEIIIQQPTHTNTIKNRPSSKKEKNYFEECVNGVCNFFSKKKVDGGRTKKKKTKTKTKKIIMKYKKK